MIQFYGRPLQKPFCLSPRPHSPLLFSWDPGLDGFRSRRLPLSPCCLPGHDHGKEKGLSIGSLLYRKITDKRRMAQWPQRQRMQGCPLQPTPMEPDHHQWKGEPDVNSSTDCSKRSHGDLNSGLVLGTRSRQAYLTLMDPQRETISVYIDSERGHSSQQECRSHSMESAMFYFPTSLRCEERMVPAGVISPRVL